METSVYLGRQPIYGANREIRAYELLYRRSLGDDAARVNNADQASAEVMLKAIIEIGLNKVSAERTVFINHTRALLLMHPILPPDRCVVEVLENIAADPETLEALGRLKKLGYRIALDDFVCRPDLEAMIRLADYVKLDYRALGAGGFREQVRLAKRFPVTIVAEKIGNEAELRWCRQEGCALFQGYYLRKPELLVGRRIPSNRLSVLSLLTECANVDTSARVIAAIISRDVARHGRPRRLSAGVPGGRAPACPHVRAGFERLRQLGAGGVHHRAAFDAGFGAERAARRPCHAPAARYPLQARSAGARRQPGRGAGHRDRLRIRPVGRQQGGRVRRYGDTAGALGRP